MKQNTKDAGASLTAEQKSAAITACALMIKGICLTTPNAEWTERIENRIHYLLRQITTAPTPETAFDMLAHLQRQREWSERTFGPGSRAKGVVDHIRRELLEIESDPTDITEWIDVVILALDGAWRAGAKPQQIIETIVAKQTKNEGRNWPDWRTADPNKAIEHDRSGELCPQCNGKGAMLFRSPDEAWDMTCGVCSGKGALAATAQSDADGKS